MLLYSLTGILFDKTCIHPQGEFLCDEIIAFLKKLKIVFVLLHRCEMFRQPGACGGTCLWRASEYGRFIRRFQPAISCYLARW
jgi:hypothetical protein